MDLKKILESAIIHLQEVIDERPAASVSRVLEAENEVKKAEEAIKEFEAKQPKVEVEVKKVKKIKEVKE